MRAGSSTTGRHDTQVHEICRYITRDDAASGADAEAFAAVDVSAGPDDAMSVRDDGPENTGSVPKVDTRTFL